MTKRAYPFEVGVLRQFKVHVNNFECDKSSLRAIQSKTIAKLFAAQNPELAQMKDIKHGCCKEKNVMQTQISSYFQCNNPTGNRMNLDDKLNNPQRINCCSYCDCPSEIVYDCRVCNEAFCMSCSFADYNMDNDEGRICMTCS